MQKQYVELMFFFLSPSEFYLSAQVVQIKQQLNLAAIQPPVGKNPFLLINSDNPWGRYTFAPKNRGWKSNRIYDKFYMYSCKCALHLHKIPPLLRSMYFVTFASQSKPPCRRSDKEK